MNTPAIILSSLDFRRIEDLLERTRDLPPGVEEALRSELERAQLVEPSEIPADVVTMNSTARFRDEGDNSERELTLVYPRDADAAAGRVSILAPVGSALLGLRVGQNIDWPGPNGRLLRLRVLEVTAQPEAAGDYHR